MTDQPSVFVTAPARSGTTYLSHLLAGSLDLSCSPETNVFGILHRVTRRDPEMTFGAFEKQQLGLLMHGGNRSYCALVDRELRDERIADHPRVFAEWIIGLDCYTSGASKLEQTPRNGEHLRTARWLFPDAIIVFLLRNPFDVMQSNRATPWGTRNPAALFAIWARQYCELVRLSRTYGTRRVVIVRYERLEAEGYRNALLARLQKSGIAKRPESISVVPKNFASNDWAGRHMTQSVGDFSKRSAGKWTTQYPFLQSLGDGFMVDILRAARGRRSKSWRLRLLEMADHFARWRIAR